ncbi:class I SAM-dependent methyltransferase [Acutalibacter sp. 1XD8-36]|uniref:class I SAM-dependent methyltransferase n=1 Tax=Acutalibacter sp. 1XD8-36 TaxID=2320852 RepID=UPI00261C5376|nr:class I SAM-dependent methyltransferase [Acutalibacter sp. 1XD8-36]
MQTKDYLDRYYGGYDEDSRLEPKHGRVEFITTMSYIKKYLYAPGMRVLEIGAGTGRYSHALAREGYEVDAVELVESNIEVFKNNTQPGEPVKITQGDARELINYTDSTYDVTLLLGPMYHLFTREDQEKALAEAVRVTKPGGVIFTAYCMGDPSIIAFGFIKGNIHQLMDKGMLDMETFTPRSDPWDIFQLYRKEHIDSLREMLPVEQLHFIAADGFTEHMRETVDAMDDETYELYLRYHLTICERQDMVGWSHHTLDVFRKK